MDLDIVRVIKSIPKKHGQEELRPLMTPWGEALAADPTAVPLGEHPRPQFARQRVWVLNGWWEYAIVEDPDAPGLWEHARPPKEMDGTIRVPFSPEAPLSGVGRQLKDNELLWYRCALAVPQMDEGDRCILHFDGVDHACSVLLDGVNVAIHEGAYQPFSVDITDKVQAGTATLEMCVYDPSESGTQLRGKQRIKRGGMWYTAQSGIWQPVWLELVPEVHVEDIRMVPDIDRGALEVTAWLSGTDTLAIVVGDAQGNVVARGTSKPAEGVGVVTVRIDIPDAHLWSPDDPYLYRMRIVYGTDKIRSYCAFRSVGIEKDEQGFARLCLNHEPFFCRGVLDQGYWPDGLMTPPSDSAIVADLQAVRDLGFNMVRKHIKVESERWYWHCDKLGILVWQDMPSGGDLPVDWVARDKPTLFKGSWHAMADDNATNQQRLGAGDETYRRAWTASMSNTISRLSNHPSVILWVLFNESWGQFDAALATQLAWEIDPTRPVLSASGWYDQGTGDIHGVHNYFRGMHMFDDPFSGPSGVLGDQTLLRRSDGSRVARSRRRGARAQVISEFGGLTWHVDDHSSLEHSYGYAEFATKEEWRAALEDLIAQVDSLQEQGLSGFVYTQLSDVEEETNGLLTYDRRVNKLDQ